MRYVQFYHNSTGWNGKDFSGPVKLIPRCGSDGVLPLDGRLSLATCHALARSAADRRGAPAYQLEAGGRPFSNSRSVSPLVVLN